MRVVFALCACCLSLAGAIAAADDPARKILARVNENPIYNTAVELELSQAIGDRKLGDAERKSLKTAAIEQLVDRQLVLGYLKKTGQAASQQDVDLALAQLEKDLQAQESTVKTHCEKTGLGIADIRRALTWQLSWQRYLDRQLTAANLEKYFGKHRPEFDGTQLRVAQILFKLTEDASAEAIAAAKQRSANLRQEITAGKTTFATAAKEHSQAPSATGGGDLGWIERRKPMPEDFSAAAFALKPGEISQPVVSAFGVHLITVVEVKPGTKAWQDAEDELRPAVTRYLFHWIADQERTTAKIEYEP